MELPHHEGRHDVNNENAKMVFQAHMCACLICSVCKDLCLQVYLVVRGAGLSSPSSEDA